MTGCLRPPFQKISSLFTTATGRRAWRSMRAVMCTRRARASSRSSSSARWRCSPYQCQAQSREGEACRRRVFQICFWPAPQKISSPFSHVRATGTAFVSNSFNFVAGCLSDLLLVLIGETHSIRMPGMRTFEYPAYRRGPRRLGRALRMSRLTRSRPSSLSSSRALPLMSGLL